MKPTLKNLCTIADIPHNMPRFSPAQVAKILQVTPTTVRSWIKAKKMKALRIGDRSYILNQDLEEYITNAYIIG